MKAQNAEGSKREDVMASEKRRHPALANGKQ